MRSAEFDRIARLAATLMSASFGLVSLVEENEQRFVGNFGLEGVDGTGREISFCAHALLGDEPLVVPDATLDARFEANPQVTGEPGLHYYAGAPIVSNTSPHRLGAVCVLDTAARRQTRPAEPRC